MAFPAGATITVIGATGFVGRHLVGRLSAENVRIRIVARRASINEQWAADDRIEVVSASLTEASTPQRAAAGAWAVINLVGTTAAKNAGQFYRLHCESPSLLAETAYAEGVERLIHFSAMGASADAPALADRSKAAGEVAVKQAFARANIVRPALIFGDGDHFFTRFRSLVRKAPAVPLIGGGKTRFQPMFIEDVVDAAIRMLSDPSTAGSSFDLGAPEVLSFRELIEKLCVALDRRPALIDIPLGAARMLARATQWIPGAPLTADQVALLETDKIAGHAEHGPERLGMEPRSLQTVDAYLHGLA